MNLREQYNRDGYVVVKPDYEKSLKRSAIFSRLNDLENIFYSGADKYIAFLTCMAKDVNLLLFFTQPNILNILHDLGLSLPIISSYPVLHVMSDVLKIPGGYHGTHSHQDWPSIQGSLDSITIWTPFMKTKNNFPMEVIVGSHKHGLIDGKMNGSVMEIHTNESDFLEIECDVDDIVFMSSFLIHKTGKGGNGLRVASSIRFDNADESTFIERGYPCAQKRIVERGIKWKPTVEQVRSVFE